VVTPDPQLRQNYAAAFSRFLFRPDEAALSAAYELGRQSLESGVSLLDIVQIHHGVVIETLSGIEGPEELAHAAAAFLVEVERGVYRVQGRAEPRHRHGDVGLDPDDNRLGPAQARDLGQCAQRVAGERVDHVECGHVDDHATGPGPPDLVEELAAESEELAVVEGGVDRRHEVPPVAEDRDPQRVLRSGCVNVRHRPS